MLLVVLFVFNKRFHSTGYCLVRWLAPGNLLPRHQDLAFGRRVLKLFDRASKLTQCQKMHMSLCRPVLTIDYIISCTSHARVSFVLTIVAKLLHYV
jgi:hypothetical protein